MAFHVMTRSKIPDVTGSDIPATAGRKTRIRRTQAIAKRYAFHANAIKAFSHEYYEIFKSTYFEEQLSTTSSELNLGSGSLELCFWTVTFKTILTH